MLTRYTILKAIRAGSSTPLLVEVSGGQKYLVKLCAGLSGQSAILSEWLAGHMGVALGLPVDEPVPVRITKHTPTGHLYIEYRELIQKSLGINLALPYHEQAETYLPPANPSATERDLFDRLYLFDVLLLNIDRNAQNPNLLRAGERLIARDYESSFLFLGILERRDYAGAKSILGQLRENPFFRPGIGAATIDSFFAQLRSLDVPALVQSLPEEWLARLNPVVEDLQIALREKLRAVLHDDAAFRRLLLAVEAMVPETTADRRQRQLANRRAFEQSFREKKS